MQAQLEAALKEAEAAAETSKQQTYDLAAAYRRADNAAKELKGVRAQLVQAQEAARAAQEAAARDTTAVLEQARQSEEARGDAERRLAEVTHARDALQRQLESMLTAAQEGGQQLPTTASGEQCMLHM